jgi:hypothetical protein
MIFLNYIQTNKNLQESVRQNSLFMFFPAISSLPLPHDYEYERKGVCNIFMSNEPLRGKRMVKVTEGKTKIDWRLFMEDIADAFQIVALSGLIIA